MYFELLKQGVAVRQKEQEQYPGTIPWQDNPAKQREIAALYSSAFDLLNGQLTGPEWLSKLGGTVEADSVMCAWWPASQPGEHLFELAGPPVDLPADWVDRIDELLTVFRPADPVFIDELLRQSVNGLDNPSDPLFEQDRLIASLEAGPARIVLVIAKADWSDSWETNARDLLKSILPTISKSIETKRKLSAAVDRLDRYTL